jgi:hypothetical protein
MDSMDNSNNDDDKKSPDLNKNAGEVKNVFAKFNPDFKEVDEFLKKNTPSKGSKNSDSNNYKLAHSSQKSNEMITFKNSEHASNNPFSKKGMPSLNEDSIAIKDIE